MPKVELSCEHCTKPFSVYPGFIAHAERRGGAVRFCSRACTDKARSAGTLPGKRRRGVTVTCAVCATEVYRPQSRIIEGRVNVCSEACRMAAFKRRLIDRTGPRETRKLGAEIKCQICGTTVYRKKSMIDRRIAMTCGDRKCISAYGRSLWGLPPLTEKQARYRKGPARRATNFTAAQRVALAGATCIRCGSTDNLALDHIIPVAAGGESSHLNAQTLCQPCNNWKAKTIDRPLALAYKHSQSGG